MTSCRRLDCPSPAQENTKNRLAIFSAYVSGVAAMWIRVASPSDPSNGRLRSLSACNGWTPVSGPDGGPENSGVDPPVALLVGVLRSPNEDRRCSSEDGTSIGSVLARVAPPEKPPRSELRAELLLAEVLRCSLGTTPLRLLEAWEESGPADAEDTNPPLLAWRSEVPGVRSPALP